MIQFLLGVLTGLFGLMSFIAYTAHQYKKQDYDSESDSNDLYK